MMIGHLILAWVYDYVKVTVGLPTLTFGGVWSRTKRSGSTATEVPEGEFLPRNFHRAISNLESKISRVQEKVARKLVPVGAGKEWAKKLGRPGRARRR